MNGLAITPDMHTLVLATDGIWDVVDGMLCAQLCLSAATAEEGPTLPPTPYPPPLFSTPLKSLKNERREKEKSC